MSQQLPTRTRQQQAIAEELARRLQIDGERILFLSSRNKEEPWLPPEALTTIARQSDRFKHLDEGFQEYIAPLNQVVHHATFIDCEGNTFGRSGVATVGAFADLDAHLIAAGRAISAALTSGGINPLRPGSVVALAAGKGEPARVSPELAAAESGRNDLARIHILAKEKGLIVGKDYSKYRDFLSTHYGATSVAGFDSLMRKSVIEALDRYKPEVPIEFAELSEESEGAAH
jgi:hypothetical protein